MITSDFLQTFPEFNDPELYPPSRIDFWISIGEQLVNPNRWKKLTNQGISLYVAHQLMLDNMHGRTQGIQSSKAVDGVSVGYNLNDITKADWTHFNLTKYGLQYIQLANMMGMGPLQFNS